LDGKEGYQRSLSSPYTRPKSEDTDDYDLAALRSTLTQEYPYHAQEFERSGLLNSSQHAYADTHSTNTLRRAHRQVVRLREMDYIMMNAQRQGRISFYMTCRGEEAIHMGAASALEVGDPIFAQYREQGLLMWRGFSLEQFSNSCFTNDADLGKGRQMPVHYGCRALNYHTISSPLGTQLPQAVGAAYRLKLAGKKNVATCFFGEGCASTTDFHSALNFAATLRAPVVFICRNNGYAISTPVTDQYAGDGIVSRAPGYGMAGIRIDGNDIFAVHAAVRDAKEYALKHNAPVLIEAMTYRMGHHSTSDDSSRYRSPQEVKDFEDRYDPLARLEAFLKHHDWLTDEEAITIQDEEKMAVRRALEKAERRPSPPVEYLFEDVYHEMPPHLQEQQSQLRAHMAKYPNRY
jgi:2-oxoisovalerate dehydrogenase E1 component alpha subunit